MPDFPITSVRVRPETGRTLARLREGQPERYGSTTDLLGAAVSLLAEPCSDTARDTLALDALSWPGGPDAVRQALDVLAAGVESAQEVLHEKFAPQEWCMLADVLNGDMLDGRFSPGQYLALSVNDAHRLNGTGYRWLGDEQTELDAGAVRLGAGEMTPRMRHVEDAVTTLVADLAGLDALHGWAVVYAVRWFWAHPDVGTDGMWWLPAWRRQYASDRARVGGRPPASCRSPKASQTGPQVGL